jgi:hypothetical protein
MLVEYIKNIIDNSRWEVELKEGKYLVSRDYDCLYNTLLYNNMENNRYYWVKYMKEKIKVYLPEDMFDVKIELINIPRINLHMGIDVVNNLENYTHIRRLYDNGFMGYGSWDNNVPVIQTNETV